MGWMKGLPKVCSDSSAILKDELNGCMVGEYVGGRLVSRTRKRWTDTTSDCLKKKMNEC